MSNAQKDIKLRQLMTSKIRPRVVSSQVQNVGMMLYVYILLLCNIKNITPKTRYPKNIC